MSTIKCKTCDDEMANPCKDIVALVRLYELQGPLTRSFNKERSISLKREIEHAQSKLIAQGVPLIEEEVKVNLTLSRGLDNVRYFTLECQNKHRHMYTLSC